MTAHKKNAVLPLHRSDWRSWDLTHRLAVWASLGIVLIASSSFAIHHFVELPLQKQREQSLDRWLIERIESEFDRQARELPHTDSASTLRVSLKPVGEDPFESHIRQRLALIAPQQSFTGLFRIGPEQRLYYARVRQTSIDTWYQPLDNWILSRIADNTGLSIEWIPHARYFEELNQQELKTGQRSDLGDYLYWALLDDNNTPALFMKVQLPVRHFETSGLNGRTLYPAILGLILVVIGAWYLHRRLTWPLRELDMQLQRLSRSEHYRSDLPISGAAPEVKRLAISCSKLLEHIDDRTEELKTFSYTDALTGLGNRRAMDERRDALWGMCRRQKVFMSAVIFDLDYFKQYNDSYGHNGGDQALMDFAGILRDHFARSGDVIARSGGEEFIALLFDTHSDAALLLANRVIKSLEQKAIVHRSSPISRYLTCSAGVASIIPDGEYGPEYLITMADKALYRAKAQGRNRAIAFKRASVVKFDSPASSSEPPK